VDPQGEPPVRPDDPPDAIRHHLLGHPTDLAGHLATHGALRVPTGPNMTWQQAFIATLEASGLTGRGGGSFPAWAKLAMAYADGGGGIVVVNGMESEPASDKDKVLLTRAPHLVLDGAQLLAAACGAHEILVCVPQGWDPIADAVSRALYERAERRYSVVTEYLVRPPYRFIAGEESALAQWVDSGKALPVFRPDKSTPLRIGRLPTLVHNAETLAHVALIARHGGEPFRARGTAEQPGTCLVTIGGAVSHPGVVEVEWGTPLRDIAQRATPCEAPSAYLIGGYGGTWVGPAHFATPYSPMALGAIGVAAGVGVMIVLAPTACGLVDSARIARFLAEESSGQCGPCTYGLAAIADDLSRLSEGRPDPQLLSRLVRRLGQVDGRGACHHPDGAVGMVRSALHVFAADVATHMGGEPCANVANLSPLRFPSAVPAWQSAG
jgi:NADH:ubiquinone oxidoreductase subunit F (NADH-binding)